MRSRAKFESQMEVHLAIYHDSHGGEPETAFEDCELCVVEKEEMRQLWLKGDIG